MQEERIHATGGTVKALAKVLEKKLVSRDEVDSLIEVVEREGPPRGLKRARREVFLPGLLVLARLLRHAGATQVHHVNLSVGRMYLERLLERLGAQAQGARKDVVHDQMRVTNIRWTR